MEGPGGWRGREAGTQRQRLPERAGSRSDAERCGAGPRRRCPGCCRRRRRRRLPAWLRRRARCAPGPLLAPAPRAVSHVPRPRRSASPPFLRGTPDPRSAAERGGGTHSPPPPSPPTGEASGASCARRGRGQERAGEERRAPGGSPAATAPSFSLRRPVSIAALNQRASQLKLHCLKHNSPGRRGLRSLAY